MCSSDLTGTFQTDRVVNCAGLHSDRVAKSFGDDPEAKIIPFRGEYYELTEDAKHLCKHLIYPVPDASFPFLGVHFTRMISGAVECGPNAVLAYAREGYTKTTINIPDLFDSLTYPGFLRLAAKHWRTGLGEVWRSWSKDAFVKALRRLIPEVQAEHLRPAPAGVRAQALLPTGELVDDFLFGGEDGVVSAFLFNDPAPHELYPLSLHGALPIWGRGAENIRRRPTGETEGATRGGGPENDVTLSQHSKGPAAYPGPSRQGRHDGAVLDRRGVREAGRQNRLASGVGRL